MTTRDQEEQDWKITLMQTQNDLYRKQDRWEIAKVGAAYLVGVAVMSGAIIGLSNWLHPVNQQPMFPPGTTIIIPPQAKP